VGVVSLRNFPGSGDLAESRAMLVSTIYHTISTHSMADEAPHVRRAKMCQVTTPSRARHRSSPLITSPPLIRFATSTTFRQVCVAYPGQVMPIWVHNTSLIALRVVSAETFGGAGGGGAAAGAACVRLTAQTEVAVSPKPRRRRRLPGGEASECHPPFWARQGKEQEVFPCCRLFSRNIT